MRPINSSYDRDAHASANAAQAVLQRLEAGETLDYADVEHLDDMAWNEHIRDRVEEVPGIGYRLKQ